MKKHTLIIVAAIGFLVVALAVGAFAAVTGGRTGEKTGTDAHIEHADPLTSDPVAAATGAMAGMLSWNPGTQDSPQAAAAAISDRLTGKLQAYATSDSADPALPKQWEAWARSNDVVTAFVEPIDNIPPVDEGSTEALVRVNVKQDVVHPDGTRTPYSSGLIAVTVELVDGQWKAASYEYVSVDY